MAILQVVIGLILIFLFYSLLATTLMEMISGWLSMRGAHLQKTLKNMLASKDEQIYQLFMDNPLFQQLAGRFFGKKSPPSYLDAASFRSILIKSISKLEKGANLQEKIGAIPDDKLREVLHQLLEDVDYQFEAFQDQIVKWYDHVMDRATGWYKKMIQRWLLLLGFIIAILFNADSLAVYATLVEGAKAKPERMEALLEAAEGFVADNDTVEGVDLDSLERVLDAAQLAYKGEAGDDPLGIGWSGFQVQEFGLLDWLWKLAGWLITAIAISLGAPFWFDLLKKVIRIRSAGNLPKIISQAQEIDWPKEREKLIAAFRDEDPVG